MSLCLFFQFFFLLKLKRNSFFFMSISLFKSEKGVYLPAVADVAQLAS